jgi:hypothetical protein
LAHAGLRTEPDFDAVWLDAEVKVQMAAPAPDEPPAMGQPPKTEGRTEPLADAAQVPFIGGAIPDPTYKIGKLEAASKGVISVNPNDPVTRAVTLMMANGYSQLPIMSSERDVKGVITWASLAQKLVLSQTCTSVMSCAEQHREIGSDASLFAAIPEIVQSQYVLVRDAKDKRITGIITGSDLSLQFQQLAEPFLLLGEIEHQIRGLIENRFTAVELAEVKDPSDTERVVKSVSDLSLGECVRLLENNQRWEKLGLNIDRIEFIKQAHAIRAIRNDVMHFDPDPIGDDELLALRRFARFVMELSRFLVPALQAATA